MKISPLGDAALLLDFSREGSRAEEILQEVICAAQTLEAERIQGVVEVTPAFQTIGVYLDEQTASLPPEKSLPLLETAIRAAIRKRRSPTWRRRRRVEIPVCFDFELDLARVAERCALPPEKIIEKFLTAKFTVACIGFRPGFPYLRGLPKELRVPRLDSPRPRVPAGAVAFAGEHAGIYPLVSPGGWNVIGRTPQRLFDVTADPPALLAPLDQVRFRRITREEFGTQRE